MASSRRIGTERSKTRGLLIDATERLMLEEGYAAVSSRRVAAAAGVKPALVHYYFPTMDDLFLAVFQRGAERSLERFARAAGSSRPLHAVWKLSNELRGTVLVMEFTALSRHRKAVRAAIADYAERFRRLQLDVLREALGGTSADVPGLTPEAVVVLAAGLSIALVQERELGVTTGHADAQRFVEELLDRLEPPEGPG
ncbi:MAG: TetR/AcrR family transcriptional regulator [Acidimicrobiales bacterium]